MTEADLLPGLMSGLFTGIITESWSCFAWKEPWKVSSPNLLKTGSTINPSLVSWGFTQSGVGNPQGQKVLWSLGNTPTASCPYGHP